MKIDDKSVDEEFSLEQAVETINKAVERKREEIENLEKTKNRLKKEERIAETQSLIDYLNSDIKVYLSVVSDMLDDDSVLEGVELDDDPVSAPENYQKYLDGLSADDLENEQEAESLRADYCDAIVEEMCISIGKTALGSKKMIKVLLDDPYALERIGELIWDDEYLYDAITAIAESKKAKKGKKKK